MYLYILYVDFFLVNNTEIVVYGVFQEELNMFSIVQWGPSSSIENYDTNVILVRMINYKPKRLRKFK